MNFPNNTTAPVPAGYRRPTNRIPPPQPNCFSADLKGNVFWQAMDPYGSQFLHQKLQNRNPEDIRSIILELQDNICILMFDRLGSHVIQKLFEVCDEEQMTKLVSQVTADVPLLTVVCLNSQGSESVKKFLDCITTPQQISDVMSVFQQLTVPLVNHRIGSSVISHCFHIFPIPAEETKPILDVITDNFLEIATKRSGSRLLMKILVSKVFQLESRPLILSAVIENVYQLSQHPFGHWVVQHVINLGMHDVVRDVVAKLRRDFPSLSMIKHANYVAITLMMKCKETYAPLIHDLIVNPNFWKVHLEPYYKFDLQCTEGCSVGTLREAFDHLSCRDSTYRQNHLDGEETDLYKKKIKRSHV